MAPERRSELLRLLSALSDGELTSEQHARLEELLAADNDHRRLYLEYADLHARLLTLPSFVAAGLPSINIPRPSGSTHRRGRQVVRYVLVAAATLAASLLVQGFLLRPPVAKAPGSPRAPEAKYLATLTREVDCAWEPAAGPGAVGSRLLPGELRLRSGVARVRFDAGPELVIEG